MQNNKIKIIITTGVYPPKIGGPAQYTKNLEGEFEKMGHKVTVKTFGLENYLPSGLKHLFFFFKIIPAVLRADVVFVLDTFSVGLPSVFACKILGKKNIIRTGGDFLWEQYVEHTQKKVLLRNFYNTEIQNFSLKEKIIFKLTEWTLKNTSKIIFSTEWQKNIFIKAYGLKEENTYIVENYYGQKESDYNFESKTFISSSRNLVLKNKDILEKIFTSVKDTYPEATLFSKNLSFDKFMGKIAKSYAVICISVGEISPNMILDAIRLNRPFVCTKEVGIYERIKNVGTFVDPLNEVEIKNVILDLLSEEGYKRAKEKVLNFNFVHTWRQIVEEFLEVYKKI